MRLKVWKELGDVRYGLNPNPKPQTLNPEPSEFIGFGPLRVAGSSEAPEGAEGSKRGQAHVRGRVSGFVSLAMALGGKT